MRLPTARSRSRANTHGRVTMAIENSIGYPAAVKVGDVLTAVAAEESATKPPRILLRAVTNQGGHRCRDISRNGFQNADRTSDHEHSEGFNVQVTDAFIIDGIRTPIGNLGGSLSEVRADDLAAHAIRELMARNPKRTGRRRSRRHSRLREPGRRRQSQRRANGAAPRRAAFKRAGETNQPPSGASGLSRGRECGTRNQRPRRRSVRSRRREEHDARAVCLLEIRQAVWPRSRVLRHHTRLALRESGAESEYGTDSMGQTAENVAEQYNVTRADQDAFALRSQQKAAAARTAGRFAPEIAPVEIAQKKGDPRRVEHDEFIRPDTTLDALAKLKPAFRTDGTGSVTAGNSSGLNDGAAALLLASSSGVKAVRSHAHRARRCEAPPQGSRPRIMGMGPGAVDAPRTQARRSHDRTDGCDRAQRSVAAQGLACLRELGISDDDARVNPNGGAIALGHPLGMSGARASRSRRLRELERKKETLRALPPCASAWARAWR